MPGGDVVEAVISASKLLFMNVNATFAVSSPCHANRVDGRTKWWRAPTNIKEAMLKIDGSAASLTRVF